MELIDYRTEYCLTDANDFWTLGLRDQSQVKMILLCRADNVVAAGSVSDMFDHEKHLNMGSPDESFEEACTTKTKFFPRKLAKENFEYPPGGIY